MKAYNTPLDELRKKDLELYKESSDCTMHWSNSIPRAINFYYDYKQLSVWGKIKLAFK